MAGYTLTFTHGPSPMRRTRPSYIRWLLFTIALSGIMICLSIRRGLRGAADQLRILDNWWHSESREWDDVMNLKANARVDRRRALVTNHPPLQGDLRLPFDRWIGTDSIPGYFGGVWFIFLVATISLRLQELLDAASRYGLVVVVGMVAGGCTGNFEFVLALRIAGKSGQLRRKRGFRNEGRSTESRTSSRSCSRPRGPPPRMAR